MDQTTSCCHLSLLTSCVMRASVTYQSAINVVNARVPTERSRHIDMQHFAIQDWKEAGDIIMSFIPGIINPSDDLTKPLGWILHARHARRVMGHC